MHYHIYCQKDTFIYNDELCRSKNFGLERSIEIGCTNRLSRTYRTSTLYPSEVSNELINRYVTNFNGDFTGSIILSTGSVSGSLNCDSYLSPGGVCSPASIIDESGNYITDESDDVTALSLTSEFFIFP